MKKYLIALVSLIACTTTFAQDNLQAQKLQIVKRIYAGGGNHQTLINNSTRDFKSVFIEDERNTPVGEVGCIDYDLITQGQDSNPKEISRSLKTSITDNGHVLATFRNFGKLNNLTYVMSCNGNRCLVDDVLENGKSFKRSIRKCIRSL